MEESQHDGKYCCPRCHYVSDQKSHYRRHLQKRSLCKPLYDRTPIATLLKQLGDEEKQYKCSECSRSFAHAPSLRRHRKAHNNMSNNNAINISEVHGSNHVTVDNHNDNSVHTHNHITINVFGSETIDHVESNTQLLDSCITNLKSGVPNIVDAIFFNPDVKENNNVHIGSKGNPPSMLVYKQVGNVLKWVAVDRSVAIHEMIQKGCDVLIKYNNIIYNLNRIDGCTWDYRSQGISNIKSKKRGVYGHVRNQIILNANQASKDNT